MINAAHSFAVSDVSLSNQWCEGVAKVSSLISVTSNEKKGVSIALHNLQALLNYFTCAVIPVA